MPPVHAVAAFAVVAFALIVVPGPSVLFVVSRAVGHGRRVAFLTVIGNAAGEFTQVACVALGLGTIVARSIAVFTVVKLVGAFYLVYLGMQAIRHRREVAIAEARLAPRSTRSVLRDGYVVGVANPKSIVFFAAILPQFVDRHAALVPVQMVFLGAVFVVIALASDSAWALAAGSARQWFARSPRRLARLSAVGGVVTIGLGLRLALLRQSD